jgi:hypothetical protein
LSNFVFFVLVFRISPLLFAGHGLSGGLLAKFLSGRLSPNAMSTVTECPSALARIEHTSSAATTTSQQQQASRIFFLNGQKWSNLLLNSANFFGLDSAEMNVKVF